MNIYFEMLLSVFLLSIAIRNVWPQKMTIKAYAALCALLVIATLPITLLSYMQYGFFSILVAVCLFGLISYRNTRPQNICMGLTGCILTVIIDNLLIGILTLISDSILTRPYVGFAIIHRSKNIL